MFVKKIINYKKIMIIFVLIGFVTFAIYGFKTRENVNSGIEYCSDSSISFDTRYNLTEINDASYFYGDKIEAIALSDKVVNGIKKDLKEIGISMSDSAIRSAIIVKSSVDVVNITAHSYESNAAKLICQSCTENVYEQLSKSESNVEILMNATDIYTATISYMDSSTNLGEKIFVISEKDKIEITEGYIIKEIIKSGILGSLLFLIFITFILSIKIFWKGEQ